MSLIEQFKISVVFVAVLLAANRLPSQAHAAEPVDPPHCAAPTDRQFDLWAGDWDVLMWAARSRSPTPKSTSFSTAASCGKITKAQMDTKVRVSRSTMRQKSLAPDLGD
jgi:hypothetical protein